MFKTLFRIVVLCSLAVFISQSVSAVDYEVFEFNESQFTELKDAVNTGLDPNNKWFQDPGLLASFMDGSGSYRINEFGTAFFSNYLQIDNIDPNTSGSRYIVVEVSGWEFKGTFDSNEPEEVRFAFLDNDTGNSGSLVTAQMQIARTSETEVQIQGDAIGVGSSDLSTTETFGLVQSTGFTMVLELNRKVGTYEVFFKDGSNPSQSLGIGQVATLRDGNSIRFGINNDIGEDLDENFSIDRFVLTDTNPLTDLLTLEIDRNSGAMTLINSSGAALTGLESYAITSSAGALDSADWKPITDNYDNQSGPGDGSVDLDDDWQIDTTTTDMLSESVISGDGGGLSIAQQVVLSLDPNDGPWIQNPTEDVEMSLMFTGGVIRRVNVNFVGNGGVPIPVGDLTYDGSLTADDWTVFIAGSETDLSLLSEAQAYQQGDLNNDGVNDIFDFDIFFEAYEEANGLGSFAAMLASIPEPSTLLLCFAGSGICLLRRRRTQHFTSSSKTQRPTTSEENSMKSVQLPLTLLCAGLLSLGMANVTLGGISQDFQFNDPNGTLLADTANSIALGSTWSEDTTDMTNSSVSNGSYRIQKDNEGFGTNYFDIDNVESGKAWLVTEIAGWNFTPTLGGGEVFEEFRMAFLDNDTGTSGSTITGQFEIQRDPVSQQIELIGGLLTDTTDIGPLPLTHTRNTPFTVVLEIDEDSENYSVYYKDNTDPFVLLGTSSHVSGRDGNSVRMVANNHFGGAGEFFDIDRIYFTDVNPIAEEPDLLTLQVDLGTGDVSIVNSTSTTFEINSYRLSSSTTDTLYEFSDWHSFSDQNLDPTDGPDLDSTLGNGIGETWDESAGSDNDVLAESFLLGSSVFPNGRSESIGDVFDITADPNLIVFQYRDVDSGAVVTGNIEFITSDPDFNSDGFVTGLDFLIWQQNNGATGQTDNSNGDANFDTVVDGADLDIWESKYGTPLTGSVSAVPEPTTAMLMACAIATLSLRRRT